MRRIRAALKAVGALAIIVGIIIVVEVARVGLHSNARIANTIFTFTPSVLPSGASPTPFPGRITGRISGPNGVQAHPVWLTAFATVEGGGGYGGPPLQSDGDFATVDVPPGPYHLLVEDYSGVFSTGYVGADGSITDEHARTFVVNSGVDTHGDIVLSLGHAISGRLTGGGRGGLAGYTLALCAFPRALPCLPVSFLTSQDGTFLISGIPVGRYVLDVGSPDRQYEGSGYYGSSGLVADVKNALPVTVASDDISGLTIRLPAGCCSRSRYRIVGRATNANGEGIANVEVLAYRNGIGLSAETAPDGTYVIGGLDPGRYTLEYGDYVGHLNGYYSTGGLTSEAEATLIVITNSDAGGVNIVSP